MNKTRIGYMLAVFSLVAVMATLFLGSRTVNFAAQAEIFSSVRALKELDAKWTESALQWRAGLTSVMKQPVWPDSLIKTLDRAATDRTGEFWQSSVEKRKAFGELLATYKDALGAKFALMQQAQQMSGTLDERDVTARSASVQLLTKIVDAQTDTALDPLVHSYETDQRQLTASQQNYSLALTIYSVVLLILLGVLGYRIMKSLREVNRNHVLLQKSNAELKESQVQLVQGEKMSALGQMVAGIAHEINTPLAYIKGTFDEIQAQLVPVQTLVQGSYDLTRAMNDPATDADALKLQARNVETAASDLVDNNVMEDMNTLLDEGIHGIEQISEIVLNLKNFSRLDRARISEFSVNDGIESTLLLARNLLKNTVGEVKKDFAVLPRISGSPSQINQVFLNIISNAAHAMSKLPEKGDITLRTMLEGKDMVRIEIQDTGSGIPKDVLPKIFDPFFTTKKIGEGTGMGLSISYKIIQEHGGQILVDSEQGVGTIFSILLPIRTVETEQVVEEELLAAA